VETVATDTLLGADSIGAYGTKHQPDDATGGPCLDLMMRSSSPSMPLSTSLGDTVKASGTSNAMDLGVGELGFLNYLDSPSPPVSWR
jgi:hypothetical protein